MNKSLLFLPDISGFTKFVQNTEVEHSQHVIAELLEILIEANTQELQLAEIEGDALFFYKEEEIPSLEKLLAQMETMFTAFYSHLKLLEKNRICPCNACSTAPELKLKIIAHSGVLQFLNVQGRRKPFGAEVIEVHRLMKNSIDNDNYILLSSDLAKDLDLTMEYRSKLYQFQKGENEYDDKNMRYLYAIINNANLKLKPFAQAKKIHFDKPPNLEFEKQFPVSAKQLLEYITNYKYRHLWSDGVDKFEYNEKEVTRLGSEHICVISDKHLNFVTVTKKGELGQLIYGEMTTSPPPVDSLYQFFIIKPLTQNSCKLKLETYWETSTVIQKILIFLFAKRVLKKNTIKAMNSLYNFVHSSSLTS